MVWNTIVALSIILGSAISFILLVDQWRAWRRVKPIQRPVDEARREIALRPFHLPAAKGIERSQPRNVVHLSDARRVQ